MVEVTVTGIAEIAEEETTVNLISIYDKAEVENISEKELKDLVKTYKADY